LLYCVAAVALVSRSRFGDSLNREKAMNVLAPKMEWPGEFKAEGPDQDPTVVLIGEAKVAGVAFRIMALRMLEGLRTPDYREGVPRCLYQDALERMVDDIEDLVDSIAPCLIRINEAQYLLWMVPGARE